MRAVTENCERNYQPGTSSRRLKVSQSCRVVSRTGQRLAAAVTGAVHSSWQLDSSVTVQWPANANFGTK